MKSNKIIIIVGVVIFFVAAVFLSKSKNNTPVPAPSSNVPTNIVKENSVGNISAGIDDQMLYSNEKIGLTFAFPKNWHVGNNALGAGSLQLLNYDTSNPPSKNFTADGKINKIEVVIDMSNKYEQSSDYPAKSINEQQVEIAGQKATRTDVELARGEKERIYYIPIPLTPKKFLSIVIFGDTSNFYVLDDLVKSIQWMK